MDNETAARLADLRRRVLANEEVSAEEYAEVIASIRLARKAAGGGKPARVAAVAASGDELLNNLI